MFFEIGNLVILGLGTIHFFVHYKFLYFRQYFYLPRIMYAVADKPFVCDVCGQSYKYQMILAEHKRIHKKTYECEICKKIFSKNSALANHKRIHTDEKPYECEICKKIFSQSSTLTNHKRVHTGETPYQCVICKKAFSSSEIIKKCIQVKSHMNV